MLLWVLPMMSLETIGSVLYSMMPFIGPSAAAFTAASQVRLQLDGTGNTLVLFNTNNNFATVEMAILIQNILPSELSASDFYL